MRPVEKLVQTDLPVSTIANLAAATAMSSSDADLAKGLVGLARRIRKECVGQRRDIPNLKAPNATCESLLVWEVMPEIARRLLARSGATLLFTTAERKVPSMDIFSDEDLRRTAADGLRFSRFKTISGILRKHARPGEIEPGKILGVEFLARPIHMGNLLEISCSRLSPAPAPESPEAAEDWFLVNRRRGVPAVEEPVAESVVESEDVSSDFSPFN